MSHVTASQTECPESELQSLKDACKALGLEFMEGQRTYKWFGKWVNDYNAEDAAYKNGIKPEDYGKCEHAIRLPGCAYEIGVYRHPDTKNFRLIYDFYGPGQALRTKLGSRSEILWNKQAEILSHDIAKKKKLKCTTRTLADGSVEYVLTK